MNSYLFCAQFISKYIVSRHLNISTNIVLTTQDKLTRDITQTRVENEYFSCLWEWFNVFIRGAYLQFRVNTYILK